MPSSIKLLRSVTELRQWRTSSQGRVAFVPTMGALHEGHAELLRKARPRCDHLVLSIFVNPIQFGPNEDLAKYPRPLEKDLEVAKATGVDAVFLPTPEEMYPGSTTFVEETKLSQVLCGKFRPGHFRGVTTVVLKLFNLVQPELALFGLKDAQQFFVLKKMAEDLNLSIKIEGVPTVREADGLALSSRNVYLSPESRERAPVLYRTLCAAAEELQKGGNVTRTLARKTDLLNQNGFEVQYLECLELPNLSALQAQSLEPTNSYIIAVAAFLGKNRTRLIDNVILEPRLA